MTDTNRLVQHMNYESDTVHGHDTYMGEKKMPSLMDENSNQCDKRREMQKEFNITKGVEYREYLKHLQDGKRNDHKDMPSGKRFSEESLNANEKMSLKLQKQKELKEALDDCVKRKQDLKFESQRTEFEEDRKRSEFWEKHDDETIHSLEKAQQETQRKEHSKNEVALMWTEEKQKDSLREIYSNTLIEKDNITDLDKYQGDLLLLQKSIRAKKELFEENEEKIVEWMKNIELIQNDQEKLKRIIEQEKELEQNLKLKSEDVHSWLAK